MPYINLIDRLIEMIPTSPFYVIGTVVVFLLLAVLAISVLLGDLVRLIRHDRLIRVRKAQVPKE